MKRSVVLAVFLAALTSGALPAQETTKGDIAINVWGKSLHLGNPPPGRSFTETNLGIGLRYNISEMGTGGQFYTDANVFRNSTGGLAVSWGAGYEHPLFAIGRSDVLCGITAGVLQYQNKWWDTVSVMFAGYPYLGLRRKNATLTIGYLPATWVKGEKAPPVLFTYVSIRL